jgi:hypothetical protein
VRQQKRQLVICQRPFRRKVSKLMD